VPSRPAERVAFLPAFQPLSYRGLGSGADPDAYLRENKAVPLNELVPSFPVDAALGYLAFRGDDRYVAALGAGAVVARPYLRTNYAALAYQWIETSPPRPVPERSRTLHAFPLLALTPPARVATIANEPFESAAFFGDLDPRSIATFEPTRATGNARKAWVDARLGIPLHPEWGSAFGGVATSSLAWLSLPRPAKGTSILAVTNGRIVDDAHQVVASASKELRWWPLPPHARAVRCGGTCVVVLQGTVPPHVPEHRPLRAVRPLAIAIFTPWLARATLPAVAHGTLRLNMGYDSGWAAYALGRALPHFRIDTAFNGWSVASAKPLEVTFVERPVAFQFVLQVIVVLVMFVLYILEIDAFYREREQ